MRVILSYIVSVLTLCVLFGSCRKEQTLMPELLLAESVMDSAPDHALALLRVIDTNQLPTPADHALHALLLTQAEVKNGITLTDSTRINEAVDYYRDHPDPRRLMLSLYYSGDIQTESAGPSNPDSTLTTLLEAEQLATAQEEWFYLGLIDRDIATAYHKVFSMHLSLIYSRKAVEAFRKSGNQEYWNYERTNLANSYLNTGKFEEAKTLLDSTIAFASTIDDTLTIMTAKYQRAYSKMRLKDWEGGIEELKEVEKSGIPFSPSQDRQAMVIAYTQLGMYEEADSVYKLLDNNGGCVYTSLHQFYASNNDYANAYKALKKEQHAKDSMVWIMMKQEVTGSAHIYDQLRYEQSLQKTQNQRLIFAMILMTCICVTGLAVTYIIHRKRLLSKRITTLLKDYDILSSELRKISADTKKETSTPNADWDGLFKKQFALLDQLCSEYYNTPTAKKTAKLAKNIESTILGLKDNDLFINNIFNDINLYNDNLITELQDHTTNLSRAEYQLLALLSSGMSNQAISIIMSIDIEPLYVRKSRLKNKIAQLDFSRKTELLNIVFPPNQ